MATATEIRAIYREVERAANCGMIFQSWIQGISYERGSMEKCYTVAETVKITGVRIYVLRYWEDGRGCIWAGQEPGGTVTTTGYDIQLFLNIKELKNRGLQFKGNT